MSSTLRIRPLRGAEELDEVHRMIHDGYVEQGFIEPRPDHHLAHASRLESLAETRILVAFRQGQMVGTNAFTLDGPAGLPVDEDFPEVVERVRREGRRLATSYHLSTKPELRFQGTVVKALLRETVLRCRQVGVETCLSAFHKRHEPVYARLLRMETIAEVSTVRYLRHCPAVLMRCDFENLPAWCLRPDAIAITDPTIRPSSNVESARTGEAA